jgi:nucleotide-binding universal stress UspA family protein
METVSQVAISHPADCGDDYPMSLTTEWPPINSKPNKSLNKPTASFFADPLWLKTIVVPLDLSPESLRALDFALPLARRFGAQVHIVHVFEGARSFSTVETSPLLWSEAEAKRHLADEVELAFGTRPQSENCHLRLGNPVGEICAAVKELKADLIVLATYGVGGGKHLMLGSTTDKVIRHASCPVLVVREATRRPVKTAAEGIVLQKILVPVDFSECAREGSRYASVFATAVGADLLLMHVIQPPLERACTGTAPDPKCARVVEAAVREAEDKLERIVNFLPLLGISAESEIGVGEPVAVLTEASGRPEVDMVVTSTHGYSALRHALLGSVAEKLAREARCPVLIVPSHLREVP